MSFKTLDVYISIHKEKMYTLSVGEAGDEAKVQNEVKNGNDNIFIQIEPVDMMDIE